MYMCIRARVYVRVCMFCQSVLSHRWAGQTDRNNLWGGQLEGHKGACTEHALKSTGRELVVVTGQIQEL